MSTRPRPGEETPYNASAGTVWEYRSEYGGPRDMHVYVVFDEYCDRVPDQHPGTPFRRFLSLYTGEYEWFADDSHWNWNSVRII